MIPVSGTILEEGERIFPNNSIYATDHFPDPGIVN
jgi:hypothetical protein